MDYKERMATLWERYKEAMREVARWKLREDAFENDEWHAKLKELEYEELQCEKAYRDYAAAVRMAIEQGRAEGFAQGLAETRKKYGVN